MSLPKDLEQGDWEILGEQEVETKAMRRIAVKQYRHGLYLILAGFIVLMIMLLAYQVCFPSKPNEGSHKKGADAEGNVKAVLVGANLPNFETLSVTSPENPDTPIDFPEDDTEATDSEVTVELSSVTQAPAVFEMNRNEQAEDEVRRVTGVNWSIVRFHEGRDTVAKLARPHPRYGSETEAPPVQAIGEKQALEIAKSFLQDNKSIFGIDHSTEFGEIEVTTYKYPAEYIGRGCDYIVDMYQVFRGVPVLDAKAKVVLDVGGEIFMVKNSLSQITCLTVTPSICPDLAISIAQQYLLTTVVPREKPALCILPPDKLCWRINFYDPVFREVLVDAIGGTIVKDRPNTLK